PEEIGYNELPLLRGKNLRAFSTALRCEETKPHLPDLRPRAPELQKLVEIARSSCDVAGDCRVNSNLRVGDILEDTFVRCRLAALVMVWLQPLDRDDNIQAGKPAPFAV